MVIARRFARPLLASIFIYGGVDAVRNPSSKAPAADTVVGDMPVQVGLSSTEQLVRLDGAVKVIAGLALGVGKFPRLAALVLIGSLVPTTAAGHRFWEEHDPAKRKAQQLHFVKNASIVGGLLLAAADTEGKPSVSWRARRAARDLTHLVGGEAPSTGAFAAGAAAVSRLASSAGQSAGELVESAGELAQSAGAVIRKKAGEVTESAQQLLPA
jgi:putative oxidoreductase